MASITSATLIGTKSSPGMEVKCTMQFADNEWMPHIEFGGGPFPFPHLLFDTFTLNIQFVQQHLNILTPPTDPNRYSYVVMGRKSLLITPKPGPVQVDDTTIPNPFRGQIPGLPLPDPYYTAYAQLTLTNNRTLQSVSVITNHISLH